MTYEYGALEADRNPLVSYMWTPPFLTENGDRIRCTWDPVTGIVHREERPYKEHAAYTLGSSDAEWIGRNEEDFPTCRLVPDASQEAP